MKFYHRLCSFKQMHGSSIVPRNYTNQNPWLGKWVHRQRCYLCTREDPVKALDNDIEFIWSAVLGREG